MTGKVGFSMKRVLSIVCVGLILLLGGLCVVQTARPGLLGRVWRRVFPEKPTAAAVIVPDEEHNSKPENAHSENIYKTKSSQRRLNLYEFLSFSILMVSHFNTFVNSHGPFSLFCTEDLILTRG